MEKYDLTNYISHLIQDDRLSGLEILNEILDVIKELKDTDAAKDFYDSRIWMGICLKTLNEIPPEEGVQSCVLGMQKRINNIKFTPDMEQEIRAHTLSGYRKGLEEKSKPKNERMSGPDYFREVTSDLTQYLDLPEEIQTIVIQAMIDGFHIATVADDIAISLMMYAVTLGFEPEKMKEFFNSANAELAKKNKENNKKL